MASGGKPPTSTAHHADSRSSTGSIVRNPVLPALTGVRILAAMWVVFYHLRDQSRTLFGATAVDEPVAAGYLGVTLFFVLSGFVISYQYLSVVGSGDRRAYARYLWARFSRVYPLQLATLLALLALVLAAKAAGVRLDHADAYSPGGFVLDLTMLRAWVTSAKGWNFPAWSLSAEWFAYVAFPLIAVPFARRRPSAAALGGLVVVLLAATCLRIWLASEQIVSWPLLSIATTFPLGCIAFLVYRARGGASSAVQLVGYAAAACLLVVGFMDDPVVRGSIATLASFLLILSLVLSQAGPLHTVLSSKLLVYGGKISFAVYMTHNLTISAWARVVPAESYTSASPMVRAAVYSSYAALVVAVAAVTYHVLEMPAQRFLRRRGDCFSWTRTEPPGTSPR